MLRILKILRQMLRRTILSLLRRMIKSLLRMTSRSLPKKKIRLVKISNLSLPTRDLLLPRKLLSEMRLTRLTGMSTGPRERRNPNTTRVKRGLSVTKKRKKVTRTARRRNLPSVKKNHARKRLLVRMRGNSSD